MIDPTKCELEEHYHDPEDGGDTWYFTYPKDDYPFRGFRPLEEYGNVISFCIAFTSYPNRTYNIRVSPTVEEGDSTTDVDWRDMDEDIEYDEITLRKLEKIIKAEQGISSIVRINEPEEEEHA